MPNVNVTEMMFKVTIPDGQGEIIFELKIQIKYSNGVFRAEKNTQMKYFM